MRQTSACYYTNVIMGCQQQTAEMIWFSKGHLGAIAQ